MESTKLLGKGIWVETDGWLTVVGLVCGLVAAFVQCLSYVASRRFLSARPGRAGLLLGVSHIWMGLFSVVLFPFLWNGDWGMLTASVRPVIGAGGFYMVAQLFLLNVLGRVEASRIAPLLGLKIVGVALISALFLEVRLEWFQWGAVGLSVAAAFLLNRIGGRLPVVVAMAVLVTVMGYSLSDINIRVLVNTVGSAGAGASSMAVCLSYLFCSIVGAALLIKEGFPARKVWVDALPFSLFWYASMLFFFASVWLVGVVYSVIIQSSRGLFAIGLGVLLARWGYLHLEQQVDRRVVWRRIAAAILMIAAIALYRLDQLGLV